MRHCFQVLISILSIAVVALGETSQTSVYSTPTATQDPKNNEGPVTLQIQETPAPLAARSLSGQVTWIIQNKLPGNQILSISETHNYNVLPPINHVAGTFTSQTSIVVPSGWAGEFTLNRAGPGSARVLNPSGSRIEGNWGVNDPLDNVSVDVSYVVGYSVPITCSCGAPGQGQAIVGCNKPLFNLGNKCNNLLDRYTSSNVCLNTSPERGPPSAFFAPCQGAAYTYPDDNLAVRACYTNQITCCVGYSCPAPSRQPKARGLKVIRGRGFNRESLNLG